MRRITALAMLVALVFSTAAGADGRVVLKRFYNRVDSLIAHFEQTQRDDRGAVMQKASGTLYLQRPDRFRWVYQKPYRQVLMSNGRIFKFYDVSLKQVTIRSIDATLRATPALLLTGGAALKQAFTIEDGGSRGGLDWVELTPKTKDAQFKTIRMGLKEGQPAVMRLTDVLGQTTKITFDHVRINPGIAAKRFRLDVPDGVDVVDARGAGEGSARQPAGQ